MKSPSFSGCFFLVCLLNTLDLCAQDASRQIFPDSTECIKTVCFHGTTDTVFVEEVEIIDSVMIYLVEDIIQKEKRCIYFDTCAAVSVLFKGVKHDMEIQEGEYCIHVSVWPVPMLLFGSSTIMYFRINDHYGFIEGDKTILDSLDTTLFQKTGKGARFIYNEESLVESLYEDDSHSLYEFWILNKKWYYGRTIRCGE